MILSKSHILLIFLFCCFASVFSSRSEVFELGEDFSVNDLYDKIYYLEDPGREYTIETVTRPDFQNNFIKNTKSSINFGYTDSDYWFRLHIKDNNYALKNWFLEISYPPLDLVEIYNFDKVDSTWHKYTTGDNIPYSERKFSHRNFFYRLEHSDNNIHTYYIKVRTAGSFQVPINIICLKELIYNSNIELLVGAFFGLMAIMALYNLFIFLSLKDKNYLYYFFTVSSIIFLQLSLRGFHLSYIFEDLVKITNPMVLISMSVTMLFANLFVIKFFDLKNNGIYFYYPAYLFHLIGVAGLPLSFIIHYRILVVTLPVFATLTAVNMLFSGIYIWKKGDRSAKYFTIAWLSYIIGVVFMFFKNAGLVPGNFIFTNSMEIGAVLQVLLISFALADKYAVIRKEKEELAIKNLELEKEQTTKLKSAVEERTEELKLKNNELETSNATKDKFLSIIAHDLRNPFTALLGFGHLLENNIDQYDKSEIKSKVDLINTTAQQTYSLLENLLKWANSQKGSLPFDPVKINVKKLVEKEIDLADQQAIQKHITIYNEILSDLNVTADENMIATIFRNLISNAIKFTEKNGIIIVYCDEKESNSTVFSVKDSGVGMSENKMKDLFRIDKNYVSPGTNNEQGFGLGLILCKDFVEMHKGRIWVESSPGEGAVFKFTIPDNLNL